MEHASSRWNVQPASGREIGKGCGSPVPGPTPCQEEAEALAAGGSRVGLAASKSCSRRIQRK
jgi:hypothetical protein